MPQVSEDSPLPIVAQRLRWLLSNGCAVGTVLDVGVQGSTDFLLECCPDVPHLLFEPVDQYFPTIRRRYEGRPHELIHAALSDHDGTAWQLGYSRDGSGKVTHSQISVEPHPPGSLPNLVECKEVPRLTLDTAVSGRRDAEPYLLKVDVDGHELPILRGARATLARTSVVIVEATIPSIAAKAVLMDQCGFELFDIVDLCYYWGQLSQVDLVFVQRAWLARCPELQPWKSKPFAWDAWAPLSRNRRLAPDRA